MVQQVNVNGSIHEFPDEASPEMIQQALSSIKPINTFLGEMQSTSPEFQLGSQKNKELLDDMIGWAAGSPGMNVIGKGSIGGLNLLKKFIQKATTNISPYEQSVEKATKQLSQAEREAHVPKTGSLISNPVTQLENIENEIGKHINIEGSHDVNIASNINKRVKSVEDFWKDSYQKFEDKIRDKKFHMPVQAMDNIGYDMDAIMERIRAGANPKTVIKEMEREASAQENPFYKHLVSKAPTVKDTNAGDFLAKYRDFRDTMGELKKDLKSEKYGSMERERIKEAIEKGKGMEDQIKETLNQGLGEYKPEFDWINRGYSEQVFPLRKNPIVKAAKQGKLSSNVMKDLRTEQSGMPLLRDMVKQDNELLRNIIGQRYKVKPSEVFYPNETMRSYLDEMPEFRKLLSQKERILKETSKRKDISLKQKIMAEKELQNIQEARTSARKKIGYGIAGGVAASVGVPGIRSLGKLLVNESNE